MNPFKPISISLSPNTEKDDVWLAFKLLFQPWKWRLGSSPQALEEEFKRYLGVKYAFSFNSGRSALMAILDALELEKRSEVLLQAFTCNAAANPIIWANLKPVYVDCDEKTFNIDIGDLKRKITPNSRAVMVQHTFGLPAFAAPSPKLWSVGDKASAGKPAEMDEILDICQRNNLILIEDCAHALGAEYESKKVGLPAEARRAKVGTFGKVSFFSFSRDKVISSVYGGMIATNDDELAKKIQEYQKETGSPSNFWVLQQLAHPVLMNWLILPTYKIFGKYLLVLLQNCKILSKAVHWKEKRGRKPKYFPKRLPEALAILAQNQLKKIERFNAHRKEIAAFYRQALKELSSFELPEGSEQIYLRFTIKHPQAHKIIKEAWRKNILIGDWYDSVIAPADTKLDKMGYIKGSCPKAEKLAKQTLNLPTHINISKDDAKKIINFLMVWR